MGQHDESDGRDAWRSAAVWDAFTNARRIALVGASDRSRFTRQLLSGNDDFGFEGEIFLVNPRRDTVQGRAAFRRVSEIPGPPVDCAILSVPNRAVLESLEEVASAGVKAVVVHSAGFAELGGDGVVAQAEITSLCRQAGIGLIGPNCIGMVSFPSRVCLSGATVPIEQRAGPVGFVTQSGAIGILAMHTGRHLRFSHIVSTGNEAVITAEDVIRWLVEDPHTQVIGAFIEQIRNPDEFVAVAGAARAADKPIVTLKTGRSDAGGRAALSHTGALVGSAGALGAVCRRLGVIEAEDFDELFETLVLFSTVAERPRGPRTAIAGISGGEASALADTAESVGLPLSRPLPAAPDGPPAQNPMDLAAGLRAGATYADALDETLRAQQVGGPELYVGLRSDPDFGPILAVSLGGLYVEIHPEIVELRVPPASLDEAVQLASGLRIASTLSGFRGGRRDHTEAFARLLLSFASLAADSSGVLEAVEINPLILSDELGPVAADFKVEVPA